MTIITPSNDSKSASEQVEDKPSFFGSIGKWLSNIRKRSMTLFKKEPTLPTSNQDVYRVKPKRRCWRSKGGWCAWILGAVLILALLAFLASMVLWALAQGECDKDPNCDGDELNRHMVVSMSSASNALSYGLNQGIYGYSGYHKYPWLYTSHI